MNSAIRELRRPRCYVAAALVGGGAWWAGLPWFAAIGIVVVAFAAGVTVAIWSGGRPAPAPKVDAPSVAIPADEREVVFRREGDYWTIGPADAVFRLHDAKGLRYIHQLLTSPGRERHVLDLVTEGQSVPATAAHAVTTEVSAPAMPEPVLDAEAREAYRRRIEDLRDQLEEAEGNGDGERASRARAELEFISDELHRQTRPDGSSRTVSDETERARVNISRAIRASIAKIAEHDASLGHHLDRDIRTGTYCSYAPDPSSPISWRL